MSNTNSSVEMWRAAIDLLEQSPTAMAETREYWAEIAARFDDPLYRTDAPPELKADFLDAQLKQSKFFQRATGNVAVLAKVLEETRNATNAAEKLIEVSNIERKELIEKTILAPLEDIPTVLQDLHSVAGEGRAILFNASTVTIAVMAPWILIHDAFALYLDKPTLGATAFAVFVTLVKEGGMHLVSEAIPFIGPIIALAEKLKEQEEKGYRDFTTFVDQSIKQINLTKSVDEGLRDLNTSEQAIHDYTQSIATTNNPFLDRVARIEAFLSSERAANS